MYANCPGSERVWNTTKIPNSNTRNTLRRATARCSLTMHRLSLVIYRFSIRLPLPERPHTNREALGVLVLGALAYPLVLRTLVRTNPPNFVPSLTLLGSIVMPVTVLVFAVSGGRRVMAPTTMVAFTAIAGGVVGTVAAGTLEFDTLQRLGGLPMLFVGLIEEAAKLIVPLLLLAFVRRPDPRAG